MKLNFSFIEKNAVTMVTAVTPSNGAALSVTKPTQDAVTHGNKTDKRRISVTAVTKLKKDVVTLEAAPLLTVTNVTAVTAKKHTNAIDREAFEERAAIMEFDGGLSRAEAEAAAWIEITRRRGGALPDAGATPDTGDTAAILGWLARIKETDPATIAEVIGQCQRDADARDYFTWQAAAELPKPDPFPDDRRTCDQCANLIARRCQAAKRGEIVASRNYEPIRDLPRRCEGYAPGAADTDRRPGCERWPGLIQKGGE